MVEVNIALTAKAPRAWRANRLLCSLLGWFMVGPGLLFVLMGLLNYPMPGFLFGFGGIMLFFGVLFEFVAARMPRFDVRKTEDPLQGDDAVEESA
jgi:hypothetical protein